MADEITGAVVADSPPATPDSTPASGQAPSTPVAPVAPQEPPFHQHPRWQQVMQENRAVKAELLRQREELAQLRQPAKPAGTPRAPEEQFQRTQALAALKELIGEDDDLKALLALAKMAPQLQGVTQHVQGLRQSQYRATVQAGHEAIRQIAQENHLPAAFINGPAFEHLEDLVTGVFTRNPDLARRFLDGDREAIKEAWKKIDPFVGALRQPAIAGVAQTKNRQATLPPASRGGLPGPAAPPAFDHTDPRKATSDLHSRAEALLKERIAAAGA